MWMYRRYGILPRGVKSLHPLQMCIRDSSYNYYRPVTGKYKKKERDGIIQWYGRQGSGIFAEK